MKKYKRIAVTLGVVSVFGVGIINTQATSFNFSRAVLPVQRENTCVSGNKSTSSNSGTVRVDTLTCNDVTFYAYDAAGNKGAGRVINNGAIGETYTLKYYTTESAGTNIKVVDKNHSYSLSTYNVSGNIDIK